MSRRVRRVFEDALSAIRFREGASAKTRRRVPRRKGMHLVWLRHWHLTRDPFFGPAALYVATSGHDEAIARLVAAIEATEPSAALRADEGLGKTLVLNQAVAATRHSGANSLGFPRRSTAPT